MNRNPIHKPTLLAALGLVTMFAFAPAALAAASTEPGLGFRGLGARIGFVDPEGASSTVGLGLHLDAGEIARNVRLSPILEYWSVGVDAPGVDFDVSDFSIGADVTVDFPLQNSRMIPYAGGGLGLHFLDSNIPGADDDTKIGLNIQGGVRNDVMPNLSVFGELRFNFVEDTNQFKLLGGFTYRFIY
jgi:hypothetical protein